MKTKWIVAVVAMVAVCITACKKKDAANSGDHQADATAVSDAKQTDTSAASPTSEEAAYKSIDLRTFNLRGHVKEVKTYGEGDTINCRYLAFDEYGRVEKMTAYNFDGPTIVTFVYDDQHSFEGHFADDKDMYCQKVLERDKEHRIIQISSSEITYDDHNRWKEYVAGGWESATTCCPQTFDAQDNILTETFEGMGEGVMWSGTNTYEYIETDSHGNWTKRKLTKLESTYDFDQEPDKYDTTATTERRVITYYK